MRPLGLVIVESDREYRQFVNEKPIKPEHREFARELFSAHARFWFHDLPFLEKRVQRSEEPR